MVRSVHKFSGFAGFAHAHSFGTASPPLQAGAYKLRKYGRKDASIR